MLSRLRGILRALRPGHLTGPILGKELRISSRRRRMTVLRVAYLLLMMLFVAGMWASATHSISRNGAAWRVVHMSQAGRELVLMLGWFQFIAAQLVAVALMSTAISDEIHHATLGTLMTTPISGVQVVLGKLAGRMWHVLVLLAVSVPVLVLVRVFGGINARFIVAGTCITVCTATLLGSLSLYFSIFNRRAYAAILKTLGLAAAVFALTPPLMEELFDTFSRMAVSTGAEAVLLHSNPFLVLSLLSLEMMNPAMRPPMALCWPAACGVLLAETAVLLAISARIVRRVALRQATGEAGQFLHRRWWKRTGRPTAGVSRPPRRPGRIREITGSPVLWRELRQGMLRRPSVFVVVGLIGLSLLLVGMCFHEYRDNDMDEAEVHTVLICLLGAAGVLATAVLSATGITLEKETRAWPLLLATPMTERQILRAKLAGAWRRILPAWLPLGAYLAAFTALGLIHPALLAMLLLPIASVIILLTGTGIYMGVLCRRTTTAVIANIGVMLGLWVLFPLLFMMTLIGNRPIPPMVALVLWPHPATHTIVLALSLTGVPMIDTHATFDGTEDAYWKGERPGVEWPGSFRPDQPGLPNDYELMSLTQSALTMGVCTLGYAAVAALLLRAARRRLRRNIF